MNTRRCRGCGAEIVFVKTAGGKAMPCDNAPITYRAAPDGETIVTPNGEVTKGIMVAPGTADATGWGYRPHWAACHAATQFRKPRTSQNAGKGG